MRRQRLDLPLRGLAGEGAQAVVDGAIGTIRGVLSAEANAATVVLKVEYDADVVSPEAIHDALARAGVSHVATKSDSEVLVQSDTAKHE
jgi:copper chaperone CopZ